MSKRPAPEDITALVASLADPRVSMMLRAAHALRNLCKAHPEALQPHTRAVLRAAATCTDLRTRWNLVLVIGMLPLRGRDRALAVDLFFEALAGESGFLRAFALTGLANFAGEDQALRTRVGPLIEQALEDPSPAVRARARKLQKQLGATRKAGSAGPAAAKPRSAANLR